MGLSFILTRKYGKRVLDSIPAAVQFSFSKFSFSRKPIENTYSKDNSSEKTTSIDNFDNNGFSPHVWPSIRLQLLPSSSSQRGTRWLNKIWRSLCNQLVWLWLWQWIYSILNFVLTWIWSAFFSAWWVSCCLVWVKCRCLHHSHNLTWSALSKGRLADTLQVQRKGTELLWRNRTLSKIDGLCCGPTSWRPGRGSGSGRKACGASAYHNGATCGHKSWGHYYWIVFCTAT